MQFGVLILIGQIALIVHAAKTGRFAPWGYIMIALPVIGAAAYIVAELLPEWLGSYKGQAARQAMGRVVNPGRRYRELSDELALVDTVANRDALARECLALGKFEEASSHYEAILQRRGSEEPQYFLGKARAQLGLGQPAAAVGALDELMRLWPDFHSADGHLLYAIALEEAGRNDEALLNYQNVGQYFPGAEPRVRQAQLLQRLGRDADAKALAEEVMRGFKRAPAYVRRNERHWLASAQKLARG